ncbi:MAG: radical SAM family heme chaperone HemW [Ignavibacteriales bacterium]|nr:radical SAM family heme chaperone HemW [Ignavibacteriales bacterium]
MKNSGIYIHIPFCDHKCIYCDFYSITNYQNISAYLDSLKIEIDTYAALYKDTHVFDSIFFGGGTPSFMEPGYISEIINYIKKNFKCTGDAEITMETNPGTVDEEKIQAFLQAGINRISIGIQSFDEGDLKFLTRIHSAGLAKQTVHTVKQAGCNNISIDLIFNLPGQSKEKWRYNLETAFTLPIDHISAYSLILERGTILNKLVLDGKVQLEGEEHDAGLYEETIAFMAPKGFSQYEVSNFCKPGFECRHNNHYWHYDDYLSFGTSAHSFMNGKRWWNISSLNLYIESVKHKKHAVAGSEVPAESERLNEYTMLALRSNGIEITRLEKLFGTGWYKKNQAYIGSLAASQYIVIRDNCISLTPAGYAVCDEILVHLQ